LKKLRDLFSLICAKALEFLLGGLARLFSDPMAQFILATRHFDYLCILPASVLGLGVLLGQGVALQIFAHWTWSPNLLEPRLWIDDLDHRREWHCHWAVSGLRVDHWRRWRWLHVVGRLRGTLDWVRIHSVELW